MRSLLSPPTLAAKEVRVAEQQLLEREDELRQIQAALADAAVGKGRLVLVSGSPGIGKTALLSVAAAAAGAREMTLLSARGGELERDFAFGVVRQLLLPVTTDVRERGAELLAGPATQAADVLSQEPENSTVAGVAALYPRLDALYWLLAELAAERPIAMIVDDAHWTDGPSLAWLTYVARRVEEHPLAIIVGIRSSGPGLPGEVAALEEEPALRVTPRPLSDAAVATLIAQACGTAPEPGFAAACAHATGGNPFFAVELVRALTADAVDPVAANAAAVDAITPERVSRSILVRLGRLSEDAVRLAQTVAVLGDGAGLDETAALAGLDRARATQLVEALAQAAILADDVPLRFAHPLVRASIYGDLPSARRHERHRQAAIVLRDVAAEGERVAAQLLGTGPGEGEWAAQVLLDVGRRAAARGASASAIAYLRRAIEEPVGGELRGRCLGELGLQELRTGDAPAAVEHLTEALSLVSDVELRSAFSRELSMAHVSCGRIEEGIAPVETAIEELEGEERELALRLEAELFVYGYFVPPLLEPMAARAAARDDVVDARTPGERVALAARAFLLWRAKALDPATQVEHGERAMANGQLFLDQTPDSPLAYCAAYHLLAYERYELVERAAQVALQDARARGSTVGIAAALSLRANIHQHLGRVREAQADGEAALRAALEIDWVPGRPAVVYPLVCAHLDAGDVDAARDALARAGYEDDVPAGAPFIKARLAQAELALAENRPGDVTASGLGEDAAVAPGATTEYVEATAAEALRRQGDTAAAREMAERAVERVRGPVGSGRGLSISLRTLARTMSSAEAVPFLEEAVAAARQSPSLIEQARALVEWGAALRRSGRRAQAREPLLEGLELAHRCGAGPLEDQAREELHALGARPRKAVRTGVDSLTASELRVARLAADGLSNPEIAQTLFITRKTVEMHLGRVYSKLDISSRKDLPGALAAG